MVCLLAVRITGQSLLARRADFNTRAHKLTGLRPLRLMFSCRILNVYSALLRQIRLFSGY